MTFKKLEGEDSVERKTKSSRSRGTVAASLTSVTEKMKLRLKTKANKEL